MAQNLKVTSVRYFETRRGLGYECRTNVKGLSIWNDGNGGGTYFSGNEYSKSGREIGSYSKKYNEQELESLIDKYESMIEIGTEVKIIDNFHEHVGYVEDSIVKIIEHDEYGNYILSSGHCCSESEIEIIKTIKL
jgi:CRISPR/Cas system Type II protein with McrA/HNH and RuvC-like nuclease domain